MLKSHYLPLPLRDGGTWPDPSYRKKGQLLAEVEQINFRSALASTWAGLDWPFNYQCYGRLPHNGIGSHFWLYLPRVSPKRFCIPLLCMPQRHPEGCKRMRRDFQCHSPPPPARLRLPVRLVSLAQKLGNKRKGGKVQEGG